MSNGNTTKPKKKVQSPNNVINFPTKMVSEITLDQIQANRQAIHEIHVDETMDLVIPSLFENIDMMGIKLSQKPELIKDMNLVIDSVESLLRKYYHMDHPLQSVADQIFEESDKEQIKGDLD